MIDKVIEEIKKLKIENINNGGCGFFALTLSNRLDELGIKYKVILIGKLPFTAFISKILNRKTSYYHVMLKVNNKFIDSSGEYDFLTPKILSYLFKTICSKEYLNYIVNNAEWNNKYDIKNNSIIKEIIKNNI